ncbi:hypothetical protein ABFA07_013133 [Porites harrisoni]
MVTSVEHSCGLIASRHAIYSGTTISDSNTRFATSLFSNLRRKGNT